MDAWMTKDTFLTFDGTVLEMFGPAAREYYRRTHVAVITDLTVVQSRRGKGQIQVSLATYPGTWALCSVDAERIAAAERLVATVLTARDRYRGS